MTTDNSVLFNLDDIKKNVRSVFYKKPIKKDNFNLNVDNIETPQSIRRQRLLQHQKEKRNEAFDAHRVILEEALQSDVEDVEDIDEEEPMEVQLPKKHGSRRKKKFYANKLMMSEWMLEVPDDFMDRWSMMPCPKGRRNLLVASKGRTEAYSRRGDKLCEFNSALPGGNGQEQNRRCTLLDCIWVAKDKTYYVLDVLAWSNQPLLNCDAEFRHFWLRSKLNESTELKENNTSQNKYSILSLPSISCDDDVSDFLQSITSLPPLDGLLFHHRDAEYMSGTTPLVTWLKPFMLPEVLGIFVPSPLDEKPEGYIDFKSHILDKNKNKNKTYHDDSGHAEQLMDVVANGDDNDDTILAD